AYACFSANRFGEMMAVMTDIESRYPVNAFKPQLMFLRAVGLAHTSGYEEMIALLENFKNSYPDHELTERIDVLLDRARREAKRTPKPEPVAEIPSVRGGGGGRTVGDGRTEPAEPAFVQKDPYAPHHVVFICERKKLNVRAMRVRIEDINHKFYADLDLNVGFEEFGENDFMFVITGFRDFERANDYAKNLSSNTYVFSAVKPEDGFWGEISEENFEKLRTTLDLDAYRKYYEANYGE
ncbi:MAG: hypothetical protein K2O01_07180, partial [Bacteroidales bacterium]|nr:hypothetical protein [Bacteroidales bacterium]